VSCNECTGSQASRTKSKWTILVRQFSDLYRALCRRVLYIYVLRIAVPGDHTSDARATIDQMADVSCRPTALRARPAGFNTVRPLRHRWLSSIAHNPGRQSSIAIARASPHRHRRDNHPVAALHTTEQLCRRGATRAHLSCSTVLRQLPRRSRSRGADRALRPQMVTTASDRTWRGPLVRRPTKVLEHPRDQTASEEIVGVSCPIRRRRQVRQSRPGRPRPQGPGGELVTEALPNFERLLREAARPREPRTRKHSV